MIELTEQQRQAVKNGEAIRVAAPEIGEDVVVLRATQFDSLQTGLGVQQPANGTQHEASSSAADAEDPFEKFIGAFHSGIPDWADNHDKYLGEALLKKVRGENREKD